MGAFKCHDLDVFIQLDISSGGFRRILYLKFKMSNHKIVFLSRVVMILPGISLRK